MKEKKKSHGVQLLIRTVVKDTEGKVVSDTGQKPSKSFLQQFLKFFYGLFRGQDQTAADITGVARNIIENSGSSVIHFFIDAEVNISTHGIVVGTGDTAPTNADYKLETQLTEGVGAGQITHHAVTIENAAVVGANVDLETKRSFVNNTGSAITVKEAGIYTRWQANWSHCIIRDVLPGPVTVPDKCSLAVYYTLRTTV